MNGWILIPVFLPAAAGIFLLLSSFLQHLREVKRHKIARTQAEIEAESADLKKIHILTAAVLAVSAAVSLAAVWSGDKEVALLYLMKGIPLYFKVDAAGRLFVTVVSLIWTAVCAYSFAYMKHEG